MFQFCDVKFPRNVRVKFLPYFHVVFYILLPLSFLSIASLLPLPPPAPHRQPTNHTLTQQQRHLTREEDRPDHRPPTAIRPPPGAVPNGRRQQVARRRLRGRAGGGRQVRRRRLRRACAADASGPGAQVAGERTGRSDHRNRGGERRRRRGGQQTDGGGWRSGRSGRDWPKNQTAKSAGRKRGKGNLHAQSIYPDER